MRHKMTYLGKYCSAKFTCEIARVTTDVAKHQNLHIDQNSSRTKFYFIPVCFDLRSVVSLISKSSGISMDESVGGII